MTLLNRVLQFDYLPDPKSERVCKDYYNDTQAFVQTLYEEPPPAIVLDCERQLTPGEEFSLWGTFIVTRRGFSWRVNGGKILSGQGTHRILVTTTGQPGEKLSILAEFEDPFKKVTTTECQIPIGRK
jgi:hypothetical protein